VDVRSSAAFAAGVVRLDEVDSTQNVARELAADGAPHGLVVRAERQTAGRGRLSRRWESAPGDGLLFSIILRPGGARPPMALRDAPLVTLGAAAGMAAALGVQVKWPNDLVVDAPQMGSERAAWRKLGGVLGELETATGPDGVVGVRHIVLGVGLNVLQRAFPAELPSATSVWLERGETDREAIFERAVGAILEWHDHPQRLDLWRAHSHTLGKRVRVGDHEGIATGLAGDGALLIDGHPVHVGEIG
jgi:BirA family biotin operon repressor/biotin-[acetyl-CoA-carboxylase] ligase